VKSEAELDQIRFEKEEMDDMRADAAVQAEVDQKAAAAAAVERQQTVAKTAAAAAAAAAAASASDEPAAEAESSTEAAAAEVASLSGADATVECVVGVAETRVEVTVKPQWAPLAAKRFLSLVADGFFTDHLLYRVLPQYLVQFGVTDSPTLQVG
jgi:hypothetical protein